MRALRTMLLSIRFEAAALLLPALGAALAGCGSEPPSDSAGIPRPEVRVARIESRSFRETVEAPGQWKASVETVLPAPFDAVVESIAVGIGDRVGRGEVLAWCRTAESDAVLRGAEMMRRQATDARSIQDAEQAVAEARAAIVHVPITCPANGTVLRRQVDAGSRLSSGSELLALVMDDALVFEVRVPVSESGAIRAGMESEVSDGDGPPRAARVRSALPTSGGDQSALVWLRPSPPPARPALGRFGTAVIFTGKNIAALAVPDTAVVEDDLTGASRVALLDSSDVVRWVSVRLGPRADHARAVSGTGLRPGALLVVDGQRALLDGMHVAARP